MAASGTAQTAKRAWCEMLGLDADLGHVSAVCNGWQGRALARIQHDPHLAHLKGDGPRQERALARL